MISNPVPWPEGARCAAAFTFDLDAESLVHYAFLDRAHWRIATSSMLRYGPEIAVPRLVEIFKRLGMRQTFFVPGWCLDHYPKATRLLVDNGHEIGHHGYLHERPLELSDELEISSLRRAIQSIVDATGRRPRGYRAPSWAFSHRTLRYLVDEGFEYDSSLAGDDIPYVIENDGGSLVELPIDLPLDDWTQYACFKEFGYMLPIASPQRAMEVFRAEFDAAWKHGGLWIAVWHPFVSGRLARTDAMLELIDYMQGKGGVWFATLEEIVDHVNGCIADGGWRPRRERLPFYQGPIPEVAPLLRRAAE